ncbi:MAG: TraB/GumN family protein [Ignavibacteriae bacterium]|nr:MAG: TraB/GumN family protein [Ignavibacteriota bacterium]
MIRYLFTFLLLINIPLLSQEDKPASSLLSRITSSDMKDTSYLFGTHHLVKSSFLDSSFVIRNILQNIDEVITEVGNDPIDTPKVKKMKMTDRIYTFNDPSEEAIVDSCVKRILGKELSDFYYLKPIVVYITLDINSSASSKENFKEISKTGNSTDDYFVTNGKKLKKIIYGLETPQEQLSILLDSIPFREQISMLVALCQSLNSEKPGDVNEIDSCYQRLDLECLGAYTGENDSERLGAEILVDRRNVNWVQKIIYTITNRSAIIAVGALHLPGKMGLINLLREAGYTVEPVKMF